MNKAERDQMRMRLSDERTLDKKSRALFGLIILNVNVKCRHYYCTLVHGFLIGFFANGVELLQQNLLTNKSYYGFTAIEAPQYNSFLTIEDLIIKLLLTPLYGVYVDRYGRQKMILFGYVLIILSLVLFPIHYYSTFFSSLAWYFGVRFIYSNGSAILPIVPILADYVDNASKGKAIGISVLLMTLGASCSTLLVSILAEKNPFITYMVFTCIVAVMGIGYSLVLKPGNSYYKTPRASCEVETSHHLMTSFTGGAAIRNKRWEMVKKDCKSKPWILASYIFAFLNGTAMALVTQIMNLYVQSFGPGNEKLGSAIVLRANIASTIVSFVLGPTLDIMKPIYVAAMVFIFGIGAYSSIGIVKDPQSIGLTIIAICIGVAYSCSLMLTKYLGFKNYRTSIRGILFSIANLLIMLGTTVVAVIGGNMFKSVGRNSPFYIGSGCAVICAVLFIWLYLKSIRPQEKLNRSTRGKVVSPMLPDNGQAAPFEMFLEEEDDLDGLDQEQNVPQDSLERTPAIKDNSSPGPNSENSREGLSPMKRTLE